MRRILGPLAATALVAATGVLCAPAGPAGAVPPPRVAAAAAACGSTGVTAVVDFNGLGGSQETAGCDANGGGQAASVVFRDAGYTLSYSQAPGMNGFVCKIQGQPADGDCAQNDSFWSLWWSDGKSGRWVFSSQGVSTLDVPDGGSVAFAWHEGGGDAQPPDVAPAVHDAPSSSPSTGGSGSGSHGTHAAGGGQDGAATPSASGSATGTTTPSSSASPTAKKAKHHDRHDHKARKRTHRNHDGPTPSAGPGSATAAAGEITAGPPADTSADDTGSSFPVWLGAGIAVVVLGAAVAVPLLRRRAG